MKNKPIILIQTLFVLIATACSIEPLNEINSNRINFNVVLDSAPATKAESLGLYSEGNRTSFTLERLPETKSIQINHATTFTEIYDSFQVEGREHDNLVFYDFAQYNASTGLWTLQNVQYNWKPGKEIEVVAAASGRDNESFFGGISFNGSPNSTAVFNYTLPEEHASQQDFLVGYFRGVTDNGTVALKFNHPLTSLVFETGPLPLGVTLKINSITLEGIDASARCDIVFGENTTYTWSAHSGTVNYTQEIDKPAMEEGDVILGEDASFIVIPREFPATSDAKIVFNITENGRTYDMYAPLAGQEWKPGETNIYQISYHGEHKAALLDGPSFNNKLAELTGGSSDKVYDFTSSTMAYTEIPRVSKIKFVTLSSNTEGVLVNAPGERPIYMKKSGSATSGYVITITTDDFEFYLNEDATSMFQGLINLTSIEGLDKVNTSYVVKLNKLFAVCNKLTSVDLSHFNTENVTHMNYMFTGCEQLQSVDLSSFTTDKVKGFAGVFAHAHALNSITWGEHFQLINCTALSHLFTRCDNLVNLDLSFIQGSTSDIDVAFMFDHCAGLKTVNIKNIRGHFSRTWCTFRDCRSLQSINLGSFQTLENNYKINSMLRCQTDYAHCTITCNQVAWDKMTSNPTDTGYTPLRYSSNIVPQTF